MPGFGVKAIFRFAMQALTSTPTPLRLLVVLPFFGSILAIVLAGVLVGAGQPYLAFWLGLAAFVLLLARNGKTPAWCHQWDATLEPRNRPAGPRTLRRPRGTVLPHSLHDQAVFPFRARCPAPVRLRGGPLSRIS